MEIHDFEKQILEPPNIEGTSFLQKFKSDPSNIKICQDYLSDQNLSQQAQLILAYTILDFIRKSDDVKSLESRFLITDWCLNILFTHHQFFQKHIIKVISSIFGYIIYSLWGPEMESKFNQISKFYEICPYCQLSIINETIVSFSENDKQLKDRNHPFSNNFDTFTKISHDFILENKDEFITDLSFQIINQCITYRPFTYQNSFSPPEILHDFLSPTEVGFIIDVFIETGQISSLQCLVSILKITISYFQFEWGTFDYRSQSVTNQPSTEGFIIILDVYTENLPRILSVYLNENYPNLQLLSELIFEYSNKAMRKFLLEADNESLKSAFIEAANQIFQFCTFAFESPNLRRDELNIYSNLMLFWGKIINAFAKESEYIRPLIDLTNQITEKYCIFLMNLVLSNDPELIEAVINQDFLTSPFKLLMFSNLIDSFSPFFMIFESYAKGGKSQLSLCLVLKTASIGLEITNNSVFQEAALSERKFTIYDLSCKIIKSTAILLQQNSESISPLLEYSVLDFIEKVRTFSILSRIKDGSHISLFVWRIILTLQLFADNDELIEKANLALMSILKVDVADNENYHLYKEALAGLLKMYQTFPFFSERSIENQTQKTNKMMFFCSVYSIALKYNFLFCINEYLNSLVAEHNLLNLYVCLSGVFNFMEDSKDTVALHFINWLLPANIPILVECGKNPDEMLLVLKIFQYILQRNSQFNQIEKHSDFGIVLCEAVSSTLTESINYFLKICTDSQKADLCIQLTQKVSFCLSLLLGREYIMFDAFRIYKSPLMPNLFLSVDSFLNNVNFQSILDYPKLLISFILLMKEIIKRHLNECPKTLFVYIANFYDNLLSQNQVVIFHKDEFISKLLQKYLLKSGFSKENKESVYKVVFEDSLLKFIQYINNNLQAEFDEVKAEIHKNFLNMFCILWEITVNYRNFSFLNIIRQLVKFDPSFMEVLKTNLLPILSDTTGFLAIFAKFMEELPLLVGPEGDAKQNKFDVYCQDFFKNAVGKLHFNAP